MYKEWLATPQTPEFTARILSYEVGDIHKCLIYQERFGPGWEGELRLAVADALTMVSLLAEQLGYDLDALRHDGLERFQDRMLEVKKAEERHDD